MRDQTLQRIPPCLSGQGLDMKIMDFDCMQSGPRSVTRTKSHRVVGF